MATKLYDLQQGVSVPTGAGLTFDPLLSIPVAGVDTAVEPSIVIPVPKAAGASAAVTTAMATGNLTVVHNNLGAIDFDILTIRLHTIQEVLTALFGSGQDPRRYFTIADVGPDASKGAIYVDDDDTTRQFRVDVAKVSGDGETLLQTTQIAGTTIPAVGGADNLSLLSGTGDADIAYTGVGFEKYSDVQNAVAIANGAGTAINPGLLVAGNFPTPAAYSAPSMVIPVPKTVPTLATDQSYVATVLAAGAITIQHSEVAPVDHDVLSLVWHTIQDLQNAVFGTMRDQRRYFTILDVGPHAPLGAIYSDDDDPTRQFEVDIAKVSGDGSLLLSTRQIAGTTAPTVGGADNLSLVSGTGAAPNIAYTGVRFEKLIDLRQNVAVANGAGLTFDAGLVENGVPVMPDIVIPIPKAANTVPYVPTDLTVQGTVNVRHNGGAPVNCDILSLRAHSVFRDIGP